MCKVCRRHLCGCWGGWSITQRASHCLVSAFISITGPSEDHVTWILASDWLRVITWPWYWPLIGWEWHLHHWTIRADQTINILAALTSNWQSPRTGEMSTHWQRAITWPGYWPLIGWQSIREMPTYLRRTSVFYISIPSCLIKLSNNIPFLSLPRDLFSYS